MLRSAAADRDPETASLRPTAATHSIAETKSQRASGITFRSCNRYDEVLCHRLYISCVLNSHYLITEITKIILAVTTVLRRLRMSELNILLYHREIHSTRLTTNYCLHDVRACVHGGWSMIDRPCMRLHCSGEVLAEAVCTI